MESVSQQKNNSHGWKPVEPPPPSCPRRQKSRPILFRLPSAQCLDAFFSGTLSPPRGEGRVRGETQEVPSQPKNRNDSPLPAFPPLNASLLFASIRGSLPPSLRSMPRCLLLWNPLPSEGRGQGEGGNAGSSITTKKQQ